MKKYTLLALMILCACTGFSQDDIVIKGSSKINKKLTPQQVVDSLNKKFPNAKSVQYYKVPKDAAKNGWSISEQDNLDPDESIEYYTISFKRSDMQYYALYNPKGKLVMSKLSESVAKLPAPIRTSLNSLKEKYPGYTVKSRTYYKNIHQDSQKEYYEIIAEKGKDKKRLYYDAAGTLVKVKG